METVVHDDICKDIYSYQSFQLVIIYFIIQGALDSLDESWILANLKNRYKKKLIYVS